MKIPEELYEAMLQDSGLGSIELSDRDMGSAILPDLNYEAQLVAISALLFRNDHADVETEKQIKELQEYAQKTSGARSQLAIDEWVDLLHHSIYQSAAHSMAALGMLAPLYESMFFQAFQGIRKRAFSKSVIPQGYPRSGMRNPDKFWDCHCVFDVKNEKNYRNLVLGIEQLAEAIGLTAYLPAELQNTLKALFDYRNEMFHNGFEWPAEECTRFAHRVEKNSWGDWFFFAERNGDPFIVYMTETFSERCFDLAHKSLNAFGAYCKAHY